jgi:hypothetical protein
VQSFAECADTCAAHGGGQVCVHNFAELEALTYTFSYQVWKAGFRWQLCPVPDCEMPQSHNDILVLNTEIGRCFAASNLWTNQYSGGVSPILKEVDCNFDHMHDNEGFEHNKRCICQSEVQSCALDNIQQDWAWEDGTGTMKWKGQSPTDGSHDSYVTNYYYYYPSGYSEDSRTINMQWAPEAFALVLFVIFFLGCALSQAFIAFCPTNRKPSPIIALVSRNPKSALVFENRFLFAALH